MKRLLLHGLVAVLLAAKAHAQPLPRILFVSIPSGATVTIGDHALTGRTPQGVSAHPNFKKNSPCVLHQFVEHPITVRWASGASVTMTDVTICPPPKGQDHVALTFVRPADAPHYELDLLVERQQAKLRAAANATATAEAERRQKALRQSAYELGCVLAGGCWQPQERKTTCTSTVLGDFIDTTCRER